MSSVPTTSEGTDALVLAALLIQRLRERIEAAQRQSKAEP